MSLEISGKNILAGKFPPTDQYGHDLLGKRALKANQDICGGWHAGFDSWTGDWKERSLSHVFVGRNYQSMQVCDQCGAIKPFSRTPNHLLRMVFTDFNETPLGEVRSEGAKSIYKIPHNLNKRRGCKYRDLS